MRGIPLSEIEKNLHSIIKKSQNADVPIFLMDMYIPPSFGKEYSDGFHKIFAKVATENNIPLLPFILKDVVGKPELNQADGIHPTVEGHEIMSKVVLEDIRKWRSEWSAN